jgi:hypothetical protein
MRQQRLWIVALATAAAVFGQTCRSPRTLVASGRFDMAGSDRGTAAIYRLADGGLLLELSSPVPPRPDLEVRLILADRTTHGDESGFLVVGRLSDDQPTHRHLVPPGVELQRYGAVCIWSRAAGTSVATAPLTHVLPRRSPQ